MSPFARVSLLLGALVLVVFGVVLLKHQLSPTPVPPAFVPSEADGTSGNRRARAEPTILSPDPATEREFSENPPWREGSPVPFETPVNTQVPVPIPLPPEPPAEQPATPAGKPRPATSQNDVLSSVPRSPAPRPDAGDSSTQLPAMAIQDSLVAPASAQEVVTVANDSLWLIATRAYGRGDYHRALYLANRDRMGVVDRLPAGITLQLPPVEELHRQFPQACPRLGLASGL